MKLDLRINHLVSGKALSSSMAMAVAVAKATLFSAMPLMPHPKLLIWTRPKVRFE